jgi:hypothetical protein
VPAQILTVPEAPGKWAIRDVLAHLADSELMGGVRLRMVLAQDRPTRRSNLRLWEHLSPADLKRVGLHNERGEESLGHMRNLYAGHDLLHLNQLNRIRKSVTAAS